MGTVGCTTVTIGEVQDVINSFVEEFPEARDLSVYELLSFVADENPDIRQFADLMAEMDSPKPEGKLIQFPTPDNEG